MRGRYVLLYVSPQLPAAGTLSEGMLPHTGHHVDELRHHWPDVSDVMLNSPWPEGCERSDGCAWALDDDVFLAETKHSIKPYTLMGTLHQGIKRHM